MKKILPAIFGLLAAISANAQNQDFKNPIIPSNKKTVDQFLHSSSSNELKVDSIINEAWNLSDSTYTNSNKDTYQYSNGNNILATHYNWDNSNGEWALSFKNEYSYDANGNQILEIVSIWDASVSQWNQSSKTVKNRDQNGNDTLSLSYNWNKTLGDWEPGMQYKTDYDDAGNQTFFLMCQWNAGNTKWDSVLKSDMYLNENGLDTAEISSFWDAGTSQWNATNKSKSFYDETGLDTLTCKYNWSAESSEWIIFQKAVSKYNQNRKDSIVTVYMWDAIGGQWTGNFKFEMFYEENKEILNQYLGLDGQWLYLSKISYYFSEFTPTGVNNPSKSEIRLYPNPAKEFIMIELNDNSNSATIEIYNIQGRKVLYQRITDKEQIQIRDLPKGIYLYKIFNHGIHSTGKFQIE